MGLRKLCRSTGSREHSMTMLVGFIQSARSNAVVLRQQAEADLVVARAARVAVNRKIAVERRRSAKPAKVAGGGGAVQVEARLHAMVII